ncbi:MAG TPA: permease [Acidimicrobiia bacterium]|nr:permease [Acidimicrobiia bacterium]
MVAPGSTLADRPVAAVSAERGWPTLELLAAAGVAALVLRPVLVRVFAGPAAQTWATMFVSLTVQALPFLVLGVIVSGAIAAFVPTGSLAHLLPRRPLVAVPMASLAGVLVPGCECSSVPVAGRLVAGGAPAPAALAFMLAAPALNPVVLVATAVAFPGRPEVVVARFVASFLTAVVVGLAWARFGRPAWTERPALATAGDGPADAPDAPVGDRPAPLRRPSLAVDGRLAVFAATARHDFGHAGGFLVLGAATAATLQVFVPRSLLDGLGGSGPGAVVTLGLLAVLLAVCSEADAFVAASLVQFSPTARLAFMVVGPTVDVKLIALQVGTFGRSFAIRFAPATFVVGLASAAVVGGLLLR